MQMDQTTKKKRLFLSFYALSLLSFGLLFLLTTSSLVGCGECKYDVDCAGNSLCKGGRCVGLFDKEPTNVFDANQTYDYGPPPTTSCIEGESRACFTGAAQTRGKGECKDGTQSCVGGQWGTCTGSVTATAEVCDGKDNDCNGKIDDSVPKVGKNCLVIGQKGPCSQGQWACTQGKMVCTQIIQSKKEICGNGQDEDCDGRPDQTPPCLCTAGQTQACYTVPSTNRNKGMCKDGKQTCNASQKWEACLGEIKPTPEICDNKDNNCNGLVDDGLQRPCGITKGVCVQGKQSCVAGVWSSTCVGEIKPSPEVCDGKDNNCNGQTDENLTKLCQVPCGSGSQSCANGGWTTCKPANVRSESCNNKDDDCDGQVDEGLSRTCRSRCGTGRETCDRGQWVKCTAPQPQTEVCDGKDNDCDGQIDESSSPELQLTKSNSETIYDFAAASDGKQFAVLYSTSSKKLYFARFEVGGKAIGSPQLVTVSSTSPPYNLQLFWTGRYFGAFWRTYKYNTANRKYEYRHQYARYTSTGRRSTGRLFPTTDVSIINVAWNGRYFGTTWIARDSKANTTQLRFVRLYETGSQAGSEIALSTATNSYKYPPQIAASSSSFGIVWSDYRNKKRELYFQRVTSTGIKSGPEVAVTQTTYSPSDYKISEKGGYFVIAYKEPTASRSSQLFTCRLSSYSSSRYGTTQLTNTTNYLSNAVIAAPRLSSTTREHVLAWKESGSNRKQLLYVQRLTSQGTIRYGSKATQVTSTISYPSGIKLAALSGKIYGVFWRESRTGTTQVWFRSMCGF